MTDERERPLPVPPPGQGPGVTDPTGLVAALAHLDGLDDLATAEHAPVLESVHEALVAELARTED